MTPAIERVVRCAQAFVARHGLRDVAVAFSGGPDSTALLLGFARADRRHRTVAIHVDHRLDDGASGRRRRAAAIARELGVPFEVETLDPASIISHPRGLEAGAREARYAALHRRADALGLAHIATGHHAGDVAETMILRLDRGTGWRGLGTMAPIAGRVVRPFVALRRGDLRRAVADAGLVPAEDPSNRDPRFARSRVRHHLLPALAESTPKLEERLVRLAHRARSARRALDARLDRHLALRESAPPGRASLDLDRFGSLPASLRACALARLHEVAGAAYPPPATAVAELERQLATTGRVACDCGGGLRWLVAGARLRLERAQPDPGPFAYTLEVPGKVEIPAFAAVLDVREADVAPWMFQHHAHRVAFAARWPPGTRLTVRGRLPGDRFRPLGSPGRRRLKDVLIDRRVARGDRARIPLLTIDDAIIWVPGVALEHRFRITDEPRVWVATLTPESFTPAIG